MTEFCQEHTSTSYSVKVTLRLTSEKYKTYMQSTAWKRKKARYWKSKYPNNCYVCGLGKHRGMHLHHKTYARLGRERLTDLVPVCEPCHRYIHDFHQSHDFSLEVATEKCKGALKTKRPIRQPSPKRRNVKKTT